LITRTTLNRVAFHVLWGSIVLLFVLKVVEVSQELAHGLTEPWSILILGVLRRSDDLSLWGLVAWSFAIWKLRRLRRAKTPNSEGGSSKAFYLTATLIAFWSCAMLLLGAWQGSGLFWWHPDPGAKFRHINIVYCVQWIEAMVMLSASIGASILIAGGFQLLWNIRADLPTGHYGRGWFRAMNLKGTVLYRAVISSAFYTLSGAAAVALLAKFVGFFFAPVDWRMHLYTAMAYAVINWMPMIVLGIVALKRFHAPSISISGDPPLIWVGIRARFRRKSIMANAPCVPPQKKLRGSAKPRRKPQRASNVGKHGAPAKFKRSKHRRKSS
jgi:hypothetical protein